MRFVCKYTYLACFSGIVLIRPFELQIQQLNSAHCIKKELRGIQVPL